MVNKINSLFANSKDQKLLSLYFCAGAPTLDSTANTILAMQKAGVWVELTNLIIPDVNDDKEMIREMCRWIAGNGLADNPLHFSRFFPRYKMADVLPTPIHTLKEAKQIAQEEGIKHVYLGNV